MPLIAPFAGTAKKPHTIAVLLSHLRAQELRGALVYVGAEMHQGLFRHPDHDLDSECRGSTAKWVDGNAPALDFTVGIVVPVNGKPGEKWLMAVSYDGNDTYSVWLWAQNFAGTGKAGLIDSSVGVYDDALQSAFESMYDEALVARNGGFMPLG